MENERRTRRYVQWDHYYGLCHADSWDCVASCFFLDTARNVVAYLETIFRILKPGGVLINFGPLLYHFNDNKDAPSLELSFEQVRHVILGLGFNILDERYPLPSGYISNKESMFQLSYNCVFFVAQKPVRRRSGREEDDDESKLPPEQEQLLAGENRNNVVGSCSSNHDTSTTGLNSVEGE
eukprot:m.201223 g.201223  ORF g.201223 m.201223 type:complete len:181 (-) comp25958_c0_seq13:80-622(-)